MKLRGLSGVYELRRAPTSHAIPTTVDGSRQPAYLGWVASLRAAVFGASDGLVSNASLVMGVAAAGSDLHSVQHRRHCRDCSPARCPWPPANTCRCARSASSTSTRSAPRTQGTGRISRKPRPRNWRSSTTHAASTWTRRAASARRHRSSQPEHALEVLAREELGLNPDDLGSPIRGGLSSFVSFAVGRRAIPLMPFFVGANGRTAIYTSAGVHGTSRCSLSASP